MSTEKVKRKRNIAVTFRMNAKEYQTLQNRVEESGLTQQSYIIKAISNATITPANEIAIQKEISKSFENLIRQLRGLATNVNQMAHIANGKGYVPTLDQLIKTSEEINKFRKESEQLWQSIRSSISLQNHTEQ